MSTRTTIIFIVIVLIVVGVFWVLNQEPQQETQADTTPRSQTDTSVTKTQNGQENDQEQTTHGESQAMENRQYQNETPYFSFLYPESMHLNENGSDTLVTLLALSPDDPQRASSIGLQGELEVSLLKGGNIESYIQEVKQNQFTEQFAALEVTLDNGVTIPTITYKNAYGAHVQEAFINIGNGNVLSVWFGKSGEYSDTFLEVLRSFDWHK